MRKKVVAILLVVVLAFTPVMRASASTPIIDDVANPITISGQVGQVSYIATEIKGAALNRFVREVGERPDIAPLLQYAHQHGYNKLQATAYDITLFYTMQSGQNTLHARNLDISFSSNSNTNKAHIKLYDLSDKTVNGLVTYEEKQNGYQVIKIYQYLDGKVTLVQSIDTEATPVQCAKGNAVSTTDVVPASATDCVGCMSGCGTFAAVGCGLGLAACVAAPWICLALYVFCGAGFYTTCQSFCNSIGACP